MNTCNSYKNICFQFFMMQIVPSCEKCFASDVISLAPGEECEGDSFGSICHMSVRARSSKTIAPIDLIFLHRKYYPRGSTY